MSGAQFVDGTTALNAATLNALAPAQSYLISGVTPSTSASLVLTVPAQVVVVNPSNAPAVAVSPGATTLTVAASSDVYIDISAAGTYTQVAVANGAAPPAVTANALRLWKVVSSGTAITSVALMANPFPSGPAAAGATPAVHAYGTAATSVPSGTFTALALAGTYYDQGTVAAQHDNVTTPSRLTCRVAGVYHVTGQATFPGSGAGTYRQLTLSASTGRAANALVPPSAGGSIVTASGDFLLAVGDYVEVDAIHDAGSALLVGTATANELMWHRVG